MNRIVPGMALPLLMSMGRGDTMSAILVWVQSDHAKLFHLKPKSIHVETVHYKGAQHPVEKEGKNHPKNQTDAETFYRQLSKVILQKESAKLLLMGPSLAQQHFFRHLQAHHEPLASQVIGVERVDQMPDSEILSVGRQFLHKYYLFQSAL